MTAPLITLLIILTKLEKQKKSEDSVNYQPNQKQAELKKKATDFDLLAL